MDSANDQKGMKDCMHISLLPSELFFDGRSWSCIADGKRPPFHRAFDDFTLHFFVADDCDGFLRNGRRARCLFHLRWHELEAHALERDATFSTSRIDIMHDHILLATDQASEDTRPRVVALMYTAVS